MPDIVEFYTGRPPILKNIPTWACREPDDLVYVLEHLGELVVEQVHGSGGYGMLVGPAASADEIEMFRMLVRARPDRYIAQPTLALSTGPTLVEAGIRERHLDLPAVRAGRRSRAAHSGRPHSASLCARARCGWSTLVRAAAPRTPGFCRTSPMLGRTANDLFWMSRYVERAESMARLLEVGYRIALLPREGHGQDGEWRSTLRSAGCEQGYLAKHGLYETSRVVAFMLFDPDNPSSAYSCLATARRNARAQRTALTREMWESLNAAWITFSAIDPATLTSDKLPPLFDWIKERSALFRGTLLNTILRNDTFYFNQLGTFLERADNARASSTSNTTFFCRTTSRSAARSTVCNGRRSCARSPRTAATAGSTRATSPGRSQTI